MSYLITSMYDRCLHYFSFLCHSFGMSRNCLEWLPKLYDMPPIVGSIIIYFTSEKYKFLNTVQPKSDIDTCSFSLQKNIALSDSQIFSNMLIWKMLCLQFLLPCFEYHKFFTIGYMYYKFSYMNSCMVLPLPAAIRIF